MLAEGGDPIAKAAEHVIRGGVSAPQGGRHIARLHGQDGDVGLKPVERTFRIQDLLCVSVEFAQVGFQRDTGGIRPGLQDGHQRLDGKRPQDGPALFQQAEARGDAVIARGHKPG